MTAISRVVVVAGRFKYKEVNMTTLREYQVDAINAIKNAFKSSKEFVLASCPSSGKTIIALEHVRNNPEHNFLILPHGTNVIKEQWLKLTANISNATVELPQSLHNTQLARYHTLIIDEAHEYTDAKMISKIIAATKPKHILYLTGTPAKFIAKGTPMFVVPAEDLVPTYISDLYFGLFSTSANINVDDYNSELDVLRKKEGEFARTAEADLNSLMSAMLLRLKETNFIKASPLLAKATNFSMFGELGKTMIACNNEKQLKVIQKVLKANNVKVVASISADDYESAVINGFETDDNNVLLVLRRGILGYNMTSLVNVVDMTGSHNINRIYQLYARVMRKSEQHPLKYFFKLTSAPDMQVTHFYMNAAIHLMRRDFISKYNGKNLNEMEVKAHKARTKKGPKSEKQRTSYAAKTIAVDPFFHGVVTANALLEDIWNNQSEIFNEYATMRIGKLKEVEFGINEARQIVNITEENLLYMIKHGKVDERIYE